MKSGELTAFKKPEYSNRLEKVKSKMSLVGLDALICCDPSNMNYLTGYDGTSYYVHQMILIHFGCSQPIWIGRKMDVSGVKLTTYLLEKNILPYQEEYVDNRDLHPMSFVAKIIKENGLSNSRIGVEKDCWHFTARSAEVLISDLPNAELVDAFGLVNDIRLIKSDAEISYIKAAAKIADLAMDAGINAIQPGIRDCEVAGVISRAQFSGTNEFCGDYPAAYPQLPSGTATSAPHLTWTGRKYASECLTYLEIAGCHKRYHAPLARSICLGKTPKWLKDLEHVVGEGINRSIETAIAGTTCETVERAWQAFISKTNYSKDSRIGYSVGIGYPPDWGERNASFMKGDRTVLRENMCFHMIIGIWSEEKGYEISETIRIKNQGPPEILTNYPRELILK